MLMTPSVVKLPYARFNFAQAQLANIEAIDYFFAKQFTELLVCESLANEIPESTSIVFHVLLALNISLREGHSCLPLEVIADQHIAGSSDDNGIITHQGYCFPEQTRLQAIIDRLAIGVDDDQAIVFSNNCLYLRRYYLFEQQVISFVGANSTAIKSDEFDANAVSQCLLQLFPKRDETSELEIDWQLVAVANALNKSFSIIAGGPGTGKTYTVTKLLAALVQLSADSLSIALVAPTGKAAQRLSESIESAVQGFSGQIAEQVLQSIPSKTQTIHRLLGVIPNSPNFRFNHDNRLNIDVLLVDEVSMVDLPLMARLLSALPAHCRVILLGDAQQLPSVAAGSVLADLTPIGKSQFSSENSQFLSHVTGIKNLPQHPKKYTDYLTYLTKSRRFDGQGGIGLLAQAVIAGNSEDSWQLLQQAQQRSDQQLTWYSSSKTWFNQLIAQYYLPLQTADSLERAFELLAQFRILTPTRLGETGVEQLNLAVEQILFASSDRLDLTNPNKTADDLYHAKPIMICENDYGLGLYNGDIGMIWRNSQGHLMAMFDKGDGQYHAILPSRLPLFETVYAMTIHKTQGSEFAHVAMVLPNDPDNQLLTRELLYTGITRAKQQLTIQCNHAVWFQGVEAKVARYSGFNR